MPIIIYTDSSTPDFRMGLAIKPIVVACGNYKGHVVRSMMGKRFIGYWPKIKVGMLI